MNYQLELEKILKNLNYKPKLLLHACCGICSSYVLDYLKTYFDITILYYNPNIYPKEEYDKRYDSLEKIKNIISDKTKLINIEYNHKDFLSISKDLENQPEGGTRCDKCYYLRLEKTAKIASENNFDYFCTTLSISPYKNATKLNNIGKQLEEKYNVKYLYSDFKKKDGFKKSNDLSYKYNLYRQNYCGCEYSIPNIKKYQN